MESKLRGINNVFVKRTCIIVFGLVIPMVSAIAILTYGLIVAEKEENAEQALENHAVIFQGNSTTCSQFLSDDACDYLSVPPSAGNCSRLALDYYTQYCEGGPFNTIATLLLVISIVIWIGACLILTCFNEKTKEKEIFSEKIKKNFDETAALSSLPDEHFNIETAKDVLRKVSVLMKAKEREGHNDLRVSLLGSGS